MRSCGGLMLLEVEPGLGDGMTGRQRDAARQALVVPAFNLERGEWDPAELGRADGIRGRVWGLVIVSGTVCIEAQVATRICRSTAGPGDLMLLDGQDTGALDWRVRWSVLEESRIVALDERILVAAQRWPHVAMGVFERAGRRTWQSLRQQAISQLPQVEQRLLATLWTLAERDGRVRSGGTWLERRVTHDQLGEMVGARRPTVSLGLNSLAERGALREDGDGWLLDATVRDELLAVTDARARRR